MCHVYYPVSYTHLGVMIKGQIVQVIYGLKINAVRRAVDEELSK